VPEGRPLVADEAPEPMPARKDVGVQIDRPSGSSLVAELETLPLGTPEDDQEIIAELLRPSGRQERFRKRWIEFDCQKGVHHGKYATYQNKKRVRVPGGFIGRLNKVYTSGSYGEKRVREFIAVHKCRYPERFRKDLDECGIG
jgi:hypothetical protein